MVMSNAGSAIMGIGTGSGEGRAVNAARHAITSPLLEASIEGARGILLNIAGGSDLTLFEVNEAAAIIHDVAHPDANIIFGNVIDDALGDTVRVTVIAAGFDQFETAPERAAPARRSDTRAEPSVRPEGTESRRERPVGTAQECAGPRRVRRRRRRRHRPRRRLRRPFLPPLSGSRSRARPRSSC